MAEDDRSKRPEPAPKTGSGSGGKADPGTRDRAAPSSDEIADADLEKVSGAGEVRLRSGSGD